MTNPIKGLKSRGIEIEIGNDLIKLRPKTEDIEMFTLVNDKDIKKEDVKVISSILIEMIARANPDEDKEDIDTFVAANFGTLVTKLAPIFGFKASESKKKAEES